MLKEIDKVTYVGELICRKANNIDVKLNKQRILVLEVVSSSEIITKILQTLSHEPNLSNKHFSNNDEVCRKILFNSPMCSKKIDNIPALSIKDLSGKLNMLYVSKNIISGSDINIITSLKHDRRQSNIFKRVKNILKGVK